MKDSFIAGGQQIKSLISTMNATFEVSYAAAHETFDGTLVRVGKQERTVLTLTFLPTTAADTQKLLTIFRGTNGLVVVATTLAAGNFYLDSDLSLSDLEFDASNTHWFRLGTVVLRSVPVQ